jgi:glucose/arabinose dehydrogenase
MSTPRCRRSAVVALLAQGALIAGCGGSDSDDAGTTTASRPRPQQSGRVRLEKVGDFDQPVYITQLPGGEDLYVVEREGSVRIVRDGEVVSSPALDITDRVTADGEEQGLLSIAFPPDVPSLSSFGQDSKGHVYAVSLDGPVHRLAQ